MIREFHDPTKRPKLQPAPDFCPSKTPRRDVLRLSLDGLDAPR
jgi:hypothetical protein